MVRHIVTFRLHGTPAERMNACSQFAKALKNLPGKIPGLISMEVGINQNPLEEWDLVLTATLDKMEDVAVYANHPDHIEAAKIIAPLKLARACVDYEI